HARRRTDPERARGAYRGHMPDDVEDTRGGQQQVRRTECMRQSRTFRPMLTGGKGPIRSGAQYDEWDDSCAEEDPKRPDITQRLLEIGAWALTGRHYCFL